MNECDITVLQGLRYVGAELINEIPPLSVAEFIGRFNPYDAPEKEAKASKAQKKKSAEDLMEELLRLENKKNLRQLPWHHFC